MIFVKQFLCRTFFIDLGQRSAWLGKKVSLPVPADQVSVPKLTTIPISDAEELVEYIFLGSLNRAYRSTTFNQAPQHTPF